MIKPYLIIPKFIEQPTWGGDYIVNYKGWGNCKEYREKKIGQSYELYGKSVLSTDIVDTDDPKFMAESAFVDSTSQRLKLDEIVKENPSDMLGPSVYQRCGNMPLLIKFTQALGNSFQLHVKPGTVHPRWKPKAESWYYFEDGCISFGIKKGIDLSLYKSTCIQIQEKMAELSQLIRNGTITLIDAQLQAQIYIRDLNPQQFVNIHHTKKYDLIDLSLGGLHHSWEADAAYAPFGNVLYEVQQDVADEFSTLRSFDQGKFMEHGDIREIHIDDYFQFLDTSDDANEIDHAKRYPQGTSLLATPFYNLDTITVRGNTIDQTGDSFVHFFVRDGDVDVVTDNSSLHLGKGHSCFITWVVHSFEVRSRTPESVLLKTYIA